MTYHALAAAVCYDWSQTTRLGITLAVLERIKSSGMPHTRRKMRKIIREAIQEKAKEHLDRVRESTVETDQNTVSGWIARKLANHFVEAGGEIGQAILKAGPQAPDRIEENSTYWIVANDDRLTEMMTFVIMDNLKNNDGDTTKDTVFETAIDLAIMREMMHIIEAQMDHPI